MKVVVAFTEQVWVSSLIQLGILYPFVSSGVDNYSEKGKFWVERGGLLGGRILWVMDVQECRDRMPISNCLPCFLLERRDPHKISGNLRDRRSFLLYLLPAGQRCRAVPTYWGIHGIVTLSDLRWEEGSQDLPGRPCWLLWLGLVISLGYHLAPAWELAENHQLSTRL